MNGKSGVIQINEDQEEIELDEKNLRDFARRSSVHIRNLKI